jgi:hypothetical protein
MFWFVAPIAGLLLVSVWMLAAGGGEPPSSIQTFRRDSAAEMEFERRASRLRWVGYCALGLAVLIASVEYLITHVWP